MTQRIDLYECEFCQKRYVDNLKFKKHTCKFSKRNDISDTIEFKRSFNLYKKWRKLKGVPIGDKKQYIRSKFFLSFIRLSEFNQKYGIPDICDYMQYMMDTGLQPTMWCNEDYYLNYLSVYDSTKTPIDMLEISVKTIYELSSIFGCKPSNALLQLNFEETVKLISSRKLSPWFLLLWRPFYIFLAMRMSKIQRESLLCIINAEKYKNNFKEDPNLVKQLKSKLIEYGLE